MNKILKQKCVIYARVSSREQEETGYSLPAQEKALSDYAERMGYKVEKIFSVSESASGKSREVFKEMLQFTTFHSIPIILCEKIDRLTRNLKDAALISDWIHATDGREVHFVKEAFVVSKNTRAHENLVWDMKVAIARFYTNNLSEEVKKGQLEKIRQGWLPTKPPLGYMTVGEKGHKIHTIDPEKAPLVKKMFELYSTGQYSLARLTEEMYKVGLRTRGGGKLVKSRVADLLRDPFYYGKMLWCGEVYDAKHEPLITRELFDSVQEIMTRKAAPKYSKHEYLFKGFIRCGDCDGLVTWETQKGIIYGHCNRYKPCPKRAWVKQADLEKVVMKELKKLQVNNLPLLGWIKDTLKGSYKEKAEYHKSCLEELYKQLERLQKRLDRLYDDRLDGNITEDFYKGKFAQFTRDKEMVVENIQKHERADSNYMELSMNLLDVAQKAPEIYTGFSTEKKRQFLGLVFKKFILKDETLILEFSEAFELLSRAVKETSRSKMAHSPQIQSITFEPALVGSTKAKTEDLTSVRTRLLRR